MKTEFSLKFAITNRENKEKLIPPVVKGEEHDKCSISTFHISKWNSLSINKSERDYFNHANKKNNFDSDAGKREEKGFTLAKPTQRPYWLKYYSMNEDLGSNYRFNPSPSSNLSKQSQQTPSNPLVIKSSFTIIKHNFIDKKQIEKQLNEQQ